MRYLGGKGRIARYILPIILDERKLDQWYVEPFVGAFNVITKVDGNRIANDLDFYVIQLYKAIRDGWVPPEFISREEYYEIKENKEKYPDYLVGFVGYGCSYAGKWFGGYARGGANKFGPRNYCKESRDNLLKMKNNLCGIKIFSGSYLDLLIPSNSIIYCDPPYKNTTSYKNEFNHEIFWGWVRIKCIQGHKVFISEYLAPEDFVPVWEGTINRNIDRDGHKKSGNEKLFMWKGK